MNRALLLAFLALAACSGKPAPSARAAGPAPTAVAKGVVEATGGLIRVLAPRDGLVAAALVQEGDRVTAAQPLAQLEDQQPRLILAASDADLGDRRAQVEVAAAKAAGAAREARRLRDLAAADAATRQDADQAATAASIAAGEQHQAQAALQAAAAHRRLAAYEIEVRTVRAPTAGRIVRRLVGPGAYAAAAAPLYVLEPDGPRIVRAELDEAFADRVAPGAAATVDREFQAGKPCRASVLRVSDILAGSALPEDAVPRAEARVITVTLALQPDCDLRLGQRVLVRFAP